MQGVRTARGEVIVMTSISFYLGNRRKVFRTYAIKPRLGKLKTRVGKLKKFFGALRRIFSKNLCPPWPETVPAPMQSTVIDQCIFVGSRRVYSLKPNA